jgi:hypothetical protein
MTRLALSTSFIVGACGVALALADVGAADTPPRLKYRGKGSVCGCSSGLSEADISRAMTGLDNLRAGEARAPGEKDAEQPKRRQEDGAAKQE